MADVWYILSDDSVADPADVSADKSGVLWHKDGRAVAYRSHGPRARMVSADEAEAYRTREMKAEPPGEADEPAKTKRAYRTREMKA